MTASDPYERGEDHDENIYVLAKEAASRSAAPPRAAMHSAPADPGRVSSVHRPPAPRRGSHHDSRQFESIMNPVTGIRDAQRRAGIKPVDHARNNRAAVREQSQINALRKINPKPEPPRRKAGLIPLAVLHDRAGKEKSEDVAKAAGCGGRDFVRENARRSAEAGPKPQACAAAGEAAGQWLNKADYGRVPKYLLDRKLQLAEQREAEEAAKKAALIPPGMRLMGEEERQQTLAMLGRNREEVEKKLQALPFVIETPSQIRNKNELERRLKEIDEASKVFSRTTVIVQE